MVTKAGQTLVMVVEDDSDIVEMLTILLPEMGYEVLAAADGAEALARLEQAPKPPALILLDLMMPVMNGWQFRREQLRIPELASIPVVVMTGAGDEQAKAAALGAVDCMPKPIDLATLRSTIVRWCDR